MLELPITIRRGTAPARSVTAWFLPGGAAHLWVSEVVRWDIPHGSLTFRVVPTAVDDLRPRGVMITSIAKNQPAASSRCHPIGQYCSRLYLPVDAVVEPEVTPQEMEGLLSGRETTYFWHPATGLIGFEPADALRLSDLLARPKENQAFWDVAEPGVHLPDRLLSVVPLQQLSIQQFLAEGGDDIGSDSSGLDELPPTTDAPRRSLADRIRRSALAAAARAISWFAPRKKGKTQSSAPSDPAAGTGLGHWIRQRINGIDSAALQQKRDRAIQRLLDMLEHNPEKGLRFALPLWGGGRQRGQAPPSHHLGNRDVDFSLGDLTSTGPAEVWDIDAHARERLIERYRQLANREIQLGRHRRAAYILGQLLGDLPSAASVLKAGGHWREAAQVYQELLDSPVAAAECLEEGHLWLEAAEIYEQLGRSERAGDAYAQGDEQDLADQSYRRAARQHVADADFLSAAQLIREKLNAPHKAIKILELGWPDSAQAQRCLEELFRQLGRLGEHEQASERIAGLSGWDPRDARSTVTADVLVQVANVYPDNAVRNLAKDSVRVLAGKGLPDVDSARARALLRSVTRLEPADRLLNRDCERYQVRRRVKTERRDRSQALGGVIAPVTRGGRRALNVSAPLRVTQLDRSVSWRTAISTQEGYFLAGLKNRELVVARGNWSGAQQSRKLGPLRAAAGLGSVENAAPILHAPGGGYADQVWLHVPGCQPFERTPFPASDAFPSVQVGAPSWIQASTVAFASSEHGWQWPIRVTDDGLLLSSYRGEELIHSTLLPTRDAWLRADEWLSLGPVPMCARYSTVLVGIQNHIVLKRAGRPSVSLELRAKIRSITAVGTAQDDPFALATARGGAVVWTPEGPPRIEPFARDLDEPILGVTTNHWLLATDQRQIELFRVDIPANRILKEGTFGVLDSKVIAILGMPAWDQFALAFADGRVQQYQLRVPTSS